jgi:hypothetical protein
VLICGGPFAGCCARWPYPMPIIAVTEANGHNHPCSDCGSDPRNCGLPLSAQYAGGAPLRKAAHNAGMSALRASRVPPGVAPRG